jgi:CBS domain-containing protein
MSLERFCRRPVVTASIDSDVDSVAHTMRDEHVGAVVIVDDGQSPVGIVTDRDIVCRVVAMGHAPQFTPVRDIMTERPVTGHVSDSLDSAIFKMRERGLRRLPIVDGAGMLAGLVSLDDLLVLLSAELGQTTQAIRQNSGP